MNMLDEDECVVTDRCVLDAAVLGGCVPGEGVHIWRALQPAEALLSRES